MRKNFFIILFLIIAVSAFSQNLRDIQVFVPPVTASAEAEANGLRAGDIVFFYRQLSFEVVSQLYTLVRSQAASDYILKGTILLESETKARCIICNATKDEIQNHRQGKDGNHEFISQEINGNLHFFNTTGDISYYHTEIDIYSKVSEDSEKYAFVLELINTKTGKVIGSQHIFYNALDTSIAELLSIIVYNMLSGFPDIIRTNEWRNKWLYLEAAVLWLPSIYQGQEKSINWLNFGLKVLVDFHPVNFFSIATGFQFKQDWVVTGSGENKVDHRDLIMEIPFLIKFVFKPPANVLLEPYGGISINQSLIGRTKPALSSWFLGFQVGVKAGPGMITIDPRFAMDIGKSHLTELDTQYTRASIQIGIGYKYGFILRKNKKEY